MLRLTTKLSIKSRIALKCDKHIRYNPEKDGRDGIKGACARCLHLLQIYTVRQNMLNAARDFEQVSKPYETIKPRILRAAPALKPGEMSQTQGWINVIQGATG